MKRRQLSGPDGLSFDQMDDGDYEAGPDQGDDERDDQPGRLSSEDEGEDEPAYERADHAKDDVPDKAITVAGHYPAGYGPGDSAQDQEPNQMHDSTSTTFTTTSLSIKLRSGGRIQHA